MVNSDMKSVEEKRAEFRKLHERGCFAIPNPWDIAPRNICNISASKRSRPRPRVRVLARLADGSVKRDDMIAHIRELVEATDLP